MLDQMIASFGVIIVFGLIVRFQQGRLNNLDKKIDTAASRKQDTRACDALMLTFKEDLVRGAERFKTLEVRAQAASEVAAEHSNLLNLIEQRVSFLADKNGFK